MRRRLRSCVLLIGGISCSPFQSALHKRSKMCTQHIKSIIHIWALVGKAHPVLIYISTKQVRTDYFSNHLQILRFPKRYQYTAMTLDLANWMKKLPSHLHDVPITQLSIPGSHDSGTYYLNNASKIAPGEGKVIKDLACIFGSVVKKIIGNWSVTQDLHVYDQLLEGVRYIDFRVAFLESEKNFLVVHGLYGSLYSEIFEEVKKFLNEHPKEFLILDFNQFYDFQAEQHKEFMNMIEESFHGMLYASSAKGITCSLNDIWDSGANIIALYKDDASTKENPLFWPHHNISSTWPNTSKADILIDKLNKQFDALKEGCLNVFQAVLSPTTSTIAMHLRGSLKDTLAKKCNQEVSSWLQDLDREKRKKLNIVICDFIEIEECASKVVALNYADGSASDE